MVASKAWSYLSSSLFHCIISVFILWLQSMCAWEPMGRNRHRHWQVLHKHLPAVAFGGRGTTANPGLPPAQSSQRLHDAVAEWLRTCTVRTACTAQSTKEIEMSRNWVVQICLIHDNGSAPVCYLLRLWSKRDLAVHPRGVSDILTLSTWLEMIFFFWGGGE